MGDKLIDDLSTNSFIDEGWHKELELMIKDVDISRDVLLNLTKYRPIPPHLRIFVWKYCLDVHDINEDCFLSFDGLYDLPQQHVIRSDCKSIADKFEKSFSSENDRISLESDLESIITHYCKSRRISYNHDLCWTPVMSTLVAVKLQKSELYNIFCVVADKFIMSNPLTNKNAYHLFRLLLLYHDPSLCQFLDTKKIFPEHYADKWFLSLFSEHCSFEVTCNIWDVYFQLADPFFVFFLVLVIVVNARDQIICMAEESKDEVIDKLSSFPSALEPEDVEDLCSLGQYYATKTPPSFKIVYQHIISSPSSSSLTLQLSSSSPLNTDSKNENKECSNVRHKRRKDKMLNTLCLEIPASELIRDLKRGSTNDQDMSQEQNEPISYLIVDCRSAEDYKWGHLINSYHLNVQLMLQNQEEFTKKVQSLISNVNNNKNNRKNKIQNNNNNTNITNNNNNNENEKLIANDNINDDGGDDNNVNKNGDDGNGVDDNDDNDGTSAHCSNITSFNGKHVCFIGYGRGDGEKKDDDDDGDDDDDNDGDDNDDDDGHINMVVAHFLQKHVQYVAVCRGGYAALHNSLLNDNTTTNNNMASKYLVGHDSKNCKICLMKNNKNKKKHNNNNNNYDKNKKKDNVSNNRNNNMMNVINDNITNDNKRTSSVTNSNLGFSSIHLPSLPVSETLEKFSKLSSAFKSTSAILKDKVITYIKNEQPSPPDRHVSSSDRVGRRYRNMASVFTIGDDDDEDSSQMLSSEDEIKEIVVIDSWIKRYVHQDSVYECFEITINYNTIPSIICLNDTHIFILRKIPDEPGKAWLQAKRSLSSVLKITSKKRQPEYITIKYGSGESVYATNYHATPVAPVVAVNTTDIAPLSTTTTTSLSVTSDSMTTKTTTMTSTTPSNATTTTTESNTATAPSTQQLQVDNNSSATTTTTTSLTATTMNQNITSLEIQQSEQQQKQQTDINENNPTLNIDTNSEQPGKVQNAANASDVTITAIDRFYIPKAGEATKDIKMHILKLMNIR